MELPVIPELTPVVYTAIFGKFDVLKPPLHPNGAKWVCLADEDLTAPAPWETVKFTSPLEPRLRSRYCKLHPHVFFPEAEITIWHGGNVQLTQPVNDYVNLLGDNDLAALPHPLRDSVYDEANACSRDGKIPPSDAGRQVSRYRLDGFPGDTRLHAAFLLVRRNTPAILALNELWWQEITSHTVRDQLSFDYCCWKLGVAISDIPYTRGSHNAGPYHRRHRHSRPRIVKPKQPQGEPAKRRSSRRKRPEGDQPGGVKQIRRSRRKKERYR